MNKFKDRALTALAGAAQALEVAVGVGLVSWATIAIAMGQLLLGGVLLALTVGIVLRFKRGRAVRRSAGRPSA